MASDQSTTPTCPVCHQADQVKTAQAAHNSGVALAAPPDMPTKQVSMMSYISACMVVVGICIFLVIVLIGGLENNFPLIYQMILVCVTLVSIIGALIVSYIAFQRVVRGDADSTRRLPAWDRAMATWQSLYYCSRDNVVFDPQKNKVLSNEQLTALRTIELPPEHAQSAVASH